jgi:Lon protease-like protein
MGVEPQGDFPLFPLPVVLLPTEVIPLHIFEERYKTMVSLCVEEGSEFGIVWLSDDGLKEIGCTARVAEVLEEMEDGRMNILVRGGTPFQLLEKQEDHVYPAGMIQLLDDQETAPGETSGGEARERYADLLEQLTDERPEAGALAELSAYEMAASVEIDLEVKQGLLELRSEEARLKLLARLFKAGIKRVKMARDIADRASKNGKVKFG